MSLFASPVSLVCKPLQLAYYVEWHIKQALAPMLFVEVESELTKRASSNVVTQAKRSKKALSKARKKKKSDKFPVHSFSTMMADLGTITLNTINTRIEGTDITFEKITQPTPLQQKAIELLNVSLVCTQ
ncbi:MAG: hypothetical protein F6K36_23285 [Symploca sp. SIO3C6]|nr:hypothetical protein [Symploca sp. SIO3C6]